MTGLVVPGGTAPSHRHAAVAFLGGRGDTTNAVYHALEHALKGRATISALLEEPQGRISLARRRAKRLGWPTVTGQVAFVGCVMPVLRLTGGRRVRQIATEKQLDFGPIGDAVNVNSVNDDRTMELLREIGPDVVVVHGTRLIADLVLKALDVPFVNLHAGITPRFRGVHGGYWALVEGRRDLVGTTVHLIDSGIDTGGILAQSTFQPTIRDSIATYPYLHIACGIPVLTNTVAQLLETRVPVVVPTLPGAENSCLRHHPTAWGYMATRVRLGVR